MPMVKLPLTLEHALLGFVRDAPTHAYEIYARLRQSEQLGLVWRMKQSQAYALLTRLEEAGYLAGSTTPQGNRPPRRVLRLTPAGHAAFASWQTTPVSHGRDFRQEFLAKLFFAQQDGPALVAALVAAQQAVTQSQLAEHQTQLARLAADRTYDRLVLEFRIGQLEATLVWLARCLDVLGQPAAALRP